GGGCAGAGAPTAEMDRQETTLFTAPAVQIAAGRAVGARRARIAGADVAAGPATSAAAVRVAEIELTAAESDRREHHRGAETLADQGLVDVHRGFLESVGVAQSRRRATSTKGSNCLRSH